MTGALTDQPHREPGLDVVGQHEHGDVRELGADAVSVCLAFVSAVLRTPVVGSAWTAYTFGAGLAMLALAVSYVVGPDDVTAWLLVVVGAVVLPAWIVWTARLSAWTSVPPMEGDDATATRSASALRDQVA